jgi:hypothetical protein
MQNHIEGEGDTHTQGSAHTNPTHKSVNLEPITVPLGGSDPPGNPMKNRENPGGEAVLNMNNQLAIMKIKEKKITMSV